MRSNDPDVNLTFDTAPRGDENKEYFQWHVRILPRLKTAAGFEMGSGMSMNTVLHRRRNDDRSQEHPDAD